MVTKLSSETATELNDVSGWTYFIQAEQGGPIKIGKTGRIPQKRLAEIMTGSPVPLRLVGLIPKDIEAELHRRFKDSRLHGEWFSVTPKLLEYIKENAAHYLAVRNGLRKDLLLRGKPVDVISSTAGYRRSVYDHYWKNEIKKGFPESTVFNLLDAWPWRGDADDDKSPLGIMTEFCLEIACCENFIDAVGFNADAKFIGVECGPVNNRKRMEVLKMLAALAGDLVSTESEFWFFAIFESRGNLVGIDLNYLGLELQDNGHVFDPSQKF